MIIIYHSKDLDGFASGAICKRKYPDAKLIGYDYGQDFPWAEVPEGEPVIMVDVSLGMVEMDELADRNPLTWIDHHILAIKALAVYENLFCKMVPFKDTKLQVGIAACEIAWTYLFPDEPMPASVKLLGMYDTWRQTDTFDWEKEILPFQYGMRLRTNSAETFPEYLFNIGLGLTEMARLTQGIEDIIDRGDTVLEYQRQQDILAMHGAFECEFQGYKAIMCNVRGANSLAFDSVVKPEHQLMVGFGYTGRQWSFSLRTTHNDVDVSLIAKQFGGGGHQKAAGFAVDDINQVIDLTKYRREKKS